MKHEINNMKQSQLLDKYFLSSVFALCFMLYAPSAHAICGVCTAAAVAGVGLSRYLGIDDLVSGIWIGGALASTTGWTVNWLRARNWNFKGSPILSALMYYGFVVVPFYYYDLVTHPRNKYIKNTYIGIDKLILGIIVGTIVFVLANKAYAIIKEKNGGHAWFPFQKVAMPIGTLLVFSLIAYFITK